jgi:hypothetical protein
MAFGEFQVTVLDSEDRPVRSYAWRADTLGNITRDALQLDGIWHEVVKVASEPDPKSKQSPPALMATVYCRRMESVPAYLIRRKRRLSLVTDTHAHTPTLRVEAGPVPRVRNPRRWLLWLAVGMTVALLGAAAIATRRPAAQPAAPPAPRQMAARPVAPAPLPPPPDPAPVVLPTKAAVPATTPAKPHRKRRPKTPEEDIINPWGDQ